jgi:N-methylhydantoinase B
MEAGDRLTFSTAGGGGWGDPMTRPRQAIEDDLRAGLISPEAARRDYGYEPAREQAAE